jgi:predicted Zn-dependent peptidase
MAVASAAAVLLILTSCATRPAERPPSATASVPATSVPAAAPKAAPSKPAAPKAAPAAVAKARSQAAPNANAKKSYLEARLSDYRSEVLPNGAKIAVLKEAGRRFAAARIVLAALPEDPAEAGYAALAFSSAAAAAEGMRRGELAAAMAETGASIEPELEDSGDFALSLRCPSESAERLLCLLARALASPDIAQEDFDLALREARMTARRDSGDPELLAAAELRRALSGASEGARFPRGTEASLAAATREGIRRYWERCFRPERLSVALVGDFDPTEKASRIAEAFSEIPSLGSSPDASASAKAIRAPLRPGFEALSLASTPGSAFLRGEYGAPDPSSSDYAAMSVALTMLDDLVAEELRAKGLAYGSRVLLSESGEASVVVIKTADPAAAKAAVDAAAAELAEGLCPDLGSVVTTAAGATMPRSFSRQPLARGLEAYKLRAIAAVYSRLAKSEEMAARIARELAAGLSGDAVFRLASAIEAVKAEDLLRVARSRLRDGSSAWIAVGDPDLIRGLEDSGSLARR